MSTRPPRDDYRGFTAIWGITAQAVMALLGFLAASFAAATFATFVLMNVDIAALDANWETTFKTLLFLGTTFVAILVTAFWPFLIALVVTEAFRLRDFLAHLLAGVAVGAAYGLPLAAIFSGAEMPDISLETLQLTIACGGLGGIVYWVIAGRTAGKWTELPWFEENRR